MSPTPSSGAPTKNLAHRILAAALACGLASCSTNERIQPHPPLALHQRSTAEVQALFLDEAVFRKGGASLSLPDPVKVGRNLGAGLAWLAWAVPSYTALAAGSAFAAGGGTPQGEVRSPVPESWWIKQEHSHHTAVRGTQLGFQADNLLSAHWSVNHEQTFIRAKGHARLSITDSHGSYYARANEIQFRPDMHAILLRGNVSISAVNAPDLKSFGLLHIDLARCQAFYTGS